jgi:hypothetical protein
MCYKYGVRYSFRGSWFCYGYDGNLAAMYDAIKSLRNVSIPSSNIPIPTNLPTY